jgi:hypothetical protein
MTDTWHQQATDHESDWLTNLTPDASAKVSRAEDAREAMFVDGATAALLALGDKRATYRRDNPVDEAQRILVGVRFATPADRIAMGELIAHQALAGSTDLTPPSVAHTPQQYLRADGLTLGPPHTSGPNTILSLKYLCGLKAS